jgi:prophage DNA circulation protein
MSWRDKLLQATFRDIPFKIIDSRTLIGRRNVLHEFPFKDDSFVEDLGLKSDRFSLNAYVVQNPGNDFDYFTERDNLITALKQKGTGILNHPFLGIMNVNVFGDITLDESFREGGIARFRITFIKSSVVLLPVQTQDDKTKIDNEVEANLSLFVENYESIYNTDNLPDRATNGHVTEITDYLTMSKNAIRNIKGSVSSTISRATSSLSELQTTLSTLIDTPSDVATSIQEGFNSFLGLVGLFEEDFGSIEPNLELVVSTIQNIIEVTRFGEAPDIDNPSAFGGSVASVSPTTERTARQSANQLAIINQVRTVAILNAMRISVRAEYTSYDEAIEIMNLVVDALELQLEKYSNELAETDYATFNVSVLDKDGFTALENLRPLFTTAMKNLGANLARVVDHNVGTEVISSLVLSHDLYDSFDNEQDIIDRNNITHPGFLPNGQTIKVLTS